MSETRRPGRARRILLLVGLLLVLGIGGYAAYHSPRVRSWFGRDADNEAEIAKLRDAKLAVAPAAATDAGWPQWRGPTRDGRAPAGPFRTDWEKNPPTRIWSAECGGGFSSLAVVGGRVYTQDRRDGNERVFCLDAATGHQLWEHVYAADYSAMTKGYTTGPRATPTVEGNRVYAVGAAGKCVCLEAPPAGGPPKLLWEHDLLDEFRATSPDWGVACSPLIEGELVIVQPGGRDGSVAAFDKTSGQLRWKAGSNPGGYSSPVAATVGGVRVVYALTGDALLCVRAADGELLDRYRWTTQHNGNIATPVVVDDYVFISSAYQKGCALLRAVPDGDQVKLEEVYARNNRVLRTHHATAAYKDGFLYGFDGDTRAVFRCVDFRRGVEKSDWSPVGMEHDKGTLFLADRHLIILTEGGDLALVEATPEEFRLVAKVHSGLGKSQTWALPVLVDGRLYLRDGEKVLCLDVR
jgi:outer membrane protein assembly factor BamB